MNREQLLTEIGLLIADNNSYQITAADVRQCLTDIVDTMAVSATNLKEEKMSDNKMEEVKYMTGAYASPRHLMAAATPHLAADYPPSTIRVPTNLTMLGNSQYGDCVSAESGFAKHCDGVVPTDAEVIAFARKYGYLNGASLTDVMNTMAKYGMTISGKAWKDGPYNSVNWEDTPTLCSAIAKGVVKIGVAASQLPQADTGWSLLTARKDRNIDHSVSLCSYGPMSLLFSSLGKTLPAGVDPNEIGYHLYTWASIGVISQKALNAICGEAWLRIPTTIGVEPTPTPTPTPPPPAPTPIPTPTPIDWNALIQMILKLIQGINNPKK